MDYQNIAKEVNITYETLFELLRLEKGREELQKLEEGFFSDVVNYLREKKKVFDNQLSSTDLFAIEEREKTHKQLANINKILRELYERREKKILTMAVNRSRTNDSVIDSSAMLPEERMMFESFVANLNKFREGILNSMVNLKVPDMSKSDDIKSAVSDDVKKEIKEDNIMVRFVNAVPRFVGKELETYGPFEEEDVANLPKEIADVLVAKGRVEVIESR